MGFERGNSKGEKSIFSCILKVVQKFMKNLGRRQRKRNDSELSDELLLVGGRLVRVSAKEGVQQSLEIKTRKKRTESKRRHKIGACE